MRFRIRFVACAALLAVTLFGATAAMAITNGVPDGTNHPYVGLMVAQDADGVPLWRCSGSLLSLDGVSHGRSLHRVARCSHRDLVRPGTRPDRSRLHGGGGR